MKSLQFNIKNLLLSWMTYVLFFFFSPFLLSSCTSNLANENVASLPSSGFGGTGYKPSGFGGTGNSSSGFGGTGIVGTVTQFGSIWVNGIEIDYGKNTQIKSNLRTKETLKLGQQVVLETLPLEDKTLTQKIHIYYPVAGEITQVKKERIILNNQIIIKINQAKIDKGLQLKVGEFVAINGFLESKKSWVATRINANPQHKIFYHPLPKLQFSSTVKQVFIESTVQQLKQWQAIHINLKQVATQRSRFILRGTFKNNRIQFDSIKPYTKPLKSGFKTKEQQPKQRHRKQIFQQQKNILGTHRQQRRIRGK